MTNKDKSIKEKISDSQFFIVLSTKNYLSTLRDADCDILNQISIARELNKPFFIIKDSRLSQEEIEEIEKYFSKDNVIQEIMVNMGDKKNSTMIIASHIRHAMRCILPCSTEKMEIITQYPLDKD